MSDAAVIAHRQVKRVVELHLSVTVAAALLGVNSRWIRDRIKSGDLEGYALSKTHHVVTAASLNRYLAQQRILPES